MDECFPRVGWGTWAEWEVTAKGFEVSFEVMKVF